MLLPLSSPVYDGEFNHGCGGGGCGDQTAAAVAAVEAVEDNLSAKAASSESVDGRMRACNNKIGRRTTTQQPTNKRRRSGGGGGSATARGRRQLGDGAAAAWRRRGGSCGGGGSAKADVGGSLVAARR